MPTPSQESVQTPLKKPYIDYITLNTTNQDCFLQKSLQILHYYFTQKYNNLTKTN